MRRLSALFGPRFIGVLAVLGGLLLFIFPMVAVVLALSCAVILAWPARRKREASELLLRLP